MGFRSTFTALHRTATASGLLAIRDRLTHSATVHTSAMTSACVRERDVTFTCVTRTYVCCSITLVFNTAISRCAQAPAAVTGVHAAETLLCSDDGDFSMASRLLTKER